MQPVAAGAMPSMMQMQVACPETSKPGDLIQVMTPSGPMQVSVPDGVAPGQVFVVQVPAAQAAIPTVMAMPVPPA